MKTKACLVVILSLAACSSGETTGSGGNQQGGSAVGSGGSLAGHGGSSMGAGGTAAGGTSEPPSFAAPPAEVSSVLVPQINPAWPLGEWNGSLNSPQIVIDCGTARQAYTQVYMISVTAGAGLDFTAKTIMESGAAIGGWTGTLTDDRQSVLVPSETRTFTDSRGDEVTAVDAPLTFKLVYASSTQLRARLYAGATYTSASESCQYQVKDYTLTNTEKRISNILQGTSTVALDAPVTLKRWGAFPVEGVGLGASEASFRHAVTPVVDGGSLPSGLVLDDQGWAVKVSSDALWFYVMVGMTNQGSSATCFYESDISGVENSAGIPVHTSVSTSYAAPDSIGVGNLVACLRAGDRGWIIGSVSVATGDSGAFTNAAIVKLKPINSAYFISDDPAPTPYQARYIAGGGFHVDVIDAALSARVVFLDDQGLPVGTKGSSDYLPAQQSSLKHVVYTISFAEPEVLGTAKTAVVYTTAYL